MNAFSLLQPRKPERPSAGISRPNLSPRKDRNFSIAPRLTDAQKARRECLAKPITNGR